MKKIFLASLVALSSFNLASAEYVNNQLTVVGDKAYDITYTSTAQTLKQYNFPQLTQTKTLELGLETYPTVQAFDTGVTVTTYEFTESVKNSDEVVDGLKTSLKSKIAAADNEQVIVFTQTITTKSYDTNLTEVGTLVNETSYTYVFVDPKEVTEDQVASGAIDIKDSSKKCNNSTRKKGGKVCAKVTF